MKTMCMIALKGIDESRAKKWGMPLSNGWRLIVNPRRHRRKVGLAYKAKTLCIYSEIVMRLSEEKVSLLVNLFAGMAYNDINACIPKEFAALLTVTLSQIRYVFEYLNCRSIESALAIAFLEYIYQNIDDEEAVSKHLECSLIRAKAITYFCKVLSPEEKL